MIRVPLAAALAWALAAPLAAQDGAGSGATALQPGDAIRISIWRNAELSGEFQIGPDGAPLHPLYRTLRLAGVPLTELQGRLQTFLEQYEVRPQFVVEPLLRVAVSGEVARPNLYYLRPDATVAEAVALAGGPTERGRRDRALLVRAGTRTALPLVRPVTIRSGDQVLVERRSAVFREIVAPVIAMAGSVAAIVGVATRR